MMVYYGAATATSINARHLEDKADIVAQAGQPGSVTIATNMAERGTDIVLHDPVRSAGGLHVMGVVTGCKSARRDRVFEVIRSKLGLRSRHESFTSSQRVPSATEGHD